MIPTVILTAVLLFNLSDLILAYCDFTHVPDDLLEFYMDLMTEYSEKMDGSREELVKAAGMVCKGLMEERKRV